MAESHLFLQRVLVSDHLPSQFMLSVPISPCRKRVAVGSRPLSHGCLRQAGSLQAGWGVASEGAERDWAPVSTVTESCLPSMAPCSHHWQKAQSCHFQQESGRDLCQQPSVPWAWPCRCSPPCCLETCGSRGACGVGATGSPAGRFPGREGSSTPLLRFLLPPQCTGGGRHTFHPGFQVAMRPPATTCRTDAAL